jgi:SAM-dependent methyltransferase
MFAPVPACWVCGGTQLTRFHELIFDFGPYLQQDPALHAYTGQTGWLVRCAACGFAQPEAMPTLPAFFDRMYAQQWSPEWVEREFEATYKDYIFERLVAGLKRRVAPARGRLLDVGAHAGRFMHVAQRAGWDVEGVELNPRTARCAARRTGAPVHCGNAQALLLQGRTFEAVTLTDVLEHIPEPVALLSSIARLIRPGGWIAVKVPCGPSQWLKERWLAAVSPTRRISIADNMVHVNHFSPRALARALQRAGFDRIEVRTAPPELPPAGSSSARWAGNLLRLAVYAAGRLPGAVNTPLALHLQAFAQRPLDRCA